jgi:hypothetical protein
MSEIKLNKFEQEIYDTVKPEYKSIVDTILNSQENSSVSHDIRPRPPYAIGTVDEMMFPIQKNVKEMLEAMIKGHGYIYVLEGGARGGKDVFGLLCWTIYLMQTPHKTHLALGKSLEHALLTILHSNGFGLYFTIPSGVFVRNSDSGAQRGIYKFKDMFGREKEILFYGNDKSTDHEKYQGFTIGSTYSNEGMTQHINGLNQAIQRMASSHGHLMIITQNPKGTAHPFYTTFEKERLMDLQDIELMEYIRDIHKFEFEEKEQEQIKLMKKDMREYAKKFCAKHKVPSTEYLSADQMSELNIGLSQIEKHHDQIIYNMPVQQFYKGIRDGDKLWDKSMRKVVNFSRKGNNPNGILNSYDYSYYHFTVDNNEGMTPMDRSDFKSQFKKGSAVYLQKVLGIRKTAENTLYGDFSERNIIDCDIHDFDNSKQTMRFISIDVGFNHKTGLIDGEVDYRTGKITVLQEAIRDYRNQKATIEDIENEFWKLVRSRKNRQMPDFVIIDPSHVATINHFESRGISVTPANNSSLLVRGKDKKYALEGQNKDVMGIELVNYGFDLKKIDIHRDCVNLIGQIESNEFEYNENTGKIKVKKIEDDLTDPLRYAVNTLLGGTQYWQNEGGENDELVSTNGTTQEGEWNMDRALAQIQNELNGDAVFGNGQGTDFGQPNGTNFAELFSKLGL